MVICHVVFNFFISVSVSSDVILLLSIEVRTEINYRYNYVSTMAFKDVLFDFYVWPFKMSDK